MRGHFKGVPFPIKCGYPKWCWKIICIQDKLNLKLGVWKIQKKKKKKKSLKDSQSNLGQFLYYNVTLNV